MKKITLLMSLLLTVGIFKSQAQQFDKENLSFGLGIGSYYYSSVSKPMNINIRGNYVLDENTAIVVGFNYHLPFEVKNENTANAFSSATNPSSISVTRTDKYTMFNISAAYYYTFVNENTDPFSLHAIVGAGLTSATVSGSYSQFDSDLYYVNNPKGASDKSVLGPIIDLGIGSNINFDKINVFIEAKLGIPATSTSANNSSSSSFDNPIPFHASLNVGVRYSIFE
jgi:hypothetical protein